MTRKRSNRTVGKGEKEEGRKRTGLGIIIESRLVGRQEVQSTGGRKMKERERKTDRQTDRQKEREGGRGRGEGSEEEKGRREREAGYEGDNIAYVRYSRGQHNFLCWCAQPWKDTN